MQRHALFAGRRAIAAAAAALCLAALPGAGLAAGARAAASGGSWGKAEAVRGLAARNKGGFAEVMSVSCPSAGNCSAVGIYANRSGSERSYSEVFAVSQQHGQWGKAEEIPGTAALNVGDYADFSTLSCSSVGNCAAAGNYAGRSGNSQVFVVSERHGRWGKAEEAPGLKAMNKGDAELESVSCAPSGSCSAGGTYTNRRGNSEAFVVSRRNGTWGQAEQVPGSAALNTGGDAQVSSLSCPSAGGCAAGGQYSLPGNQNGQPYEAFVVSQRNGRWGKAERVPGLAALDTGRESEVDSVSCASAASCTAAGYYTGRSGSSSAFVVSQRNGTWGHAQQVPGLAALDTGQDSAPGQVSCFSAGNCSVGGIYAPGRSGKTQAFVVSQHNGVWDKAEPVPGAAALNKGDNAGIGPMSCPSAGGCSAGGDYTDGSRHQQALLVSQAR